MLTEKERNELKKQVENAAIPEKTRQIFFTRWGLHDGVQRSLRVAADFHNCSPPTVKNAEDKVFSVIEMNKEDLLNR